MNENLWGLTRFLRTALGTVEQYQSKRQYTTN